MPTRCACCGKLLTGTHYPHPETGESVCGKCYETASHAYNVAWDEGLLNA